MERITLEEIKHLSPVQLHEYCTENPEICTKELWLNLLREVFPDAYRTVMYGGYEVALRQRVPRINFEPLQDLYMQLLLVAQDPAALKNITRGQVSDKDKEKIRLYYQALSFILLRSDDWFDYLVSKNDPIAIPNSAIKFSARQGDIELVQHFLLSELEHDTIRDAFEEAIKAGQIEVVEFLLSFINNQSIEESQFYHHNYIFNNAIIKASEYGHPAIVKLLLSDPRIDPSVANNAAFILAAGKGYIEVVRLLLTDPRVDPFDRKGEARRRAVEGGHTDVVKLLDYISVVTP